MAKLSTGRETLAPPERLRVKVDPGDLGFKTTAEIDGATGLIGQERAQEAISLGARLSADGFNIFAMGPEGSGRTTLIKAIIEEEAKRRPAPDDWVYVDNFKDEHRPRALRLPAGVARSFGQAMRDLIRDLAVALPSVFEGEEYKSRRGAIESSHQARQQELISGIQEKAAALDVALMRTPLGFGFAPMRDGKVLKPDEFQRLSQDKRQEAQQNIEGLQEELTSIVQTRFPAIEKEMRAEIRDMERETAKLTIEYSIAETARAFDGVEPIQTYLREVSDDLLENFYLFLAISQASEGAPLQARLEHPAMRRYAVNVMDAAYEEEGEGAPIIVESDPTHNNLIGRIEHIPQEGALITDFTMIKPGALHRANGGFLILEVRDVLLNPFSWHALKRCLKTNAIRISSMAEQLSLVSTISLEPDEIPLSVKVALVGDRMLFYLLSEFDPDFRELFKVQADFDDDLDRSPDSLRAMAGVIASVAKRNGLLPLDAPAVARLLEQVSRLADDARKLSLKVSDVADIMREADHHAREAGRKEIRVEDVTRAVEQRRRRAGRMRERSVEMITREILNIATEGAVVGQVNGLSVLSLGDSTFGRPSRITARTRMGAGKVIDIEREVKLGGPLHSKGVLILGSYLASRYGGDVPVSLAASLVFEQSYGGVEGDSASSAELYALLSSLSGLPLRQDIAVTGSVDQFGRVQAIGGVNEKIEGFFEVCDERGLTGSQGVMIPEANLQHLNLREEVVEAVRAGKFAIHAVAHIDEGVELLTGVAAGEAEAKTGKFPAGGVNALVAARLAEFAEARRRFGKQEKDGEADEGDRNEEGES